MGNNFEPGLPHLHFMNNCKPELSFDSAVTDYAQWRGKVKSKLFELIGDIPEKCGPNIHMEYESETELFYEKRIVFTSELFADVPMHLLIPKQKNKPFPLVICLQGHTTGAHISLGRAKYDGDAELIAGDRDFAVQAIKQGYAALAVELRCFGERSQDEPKPKDCVHSTMTALLIGRTMIGERIYDVSRAIDAIEQLRLPQIDMTKIACMGNSGGGTITYYAAMLDERISVAMPSCYICTFKDSIGSIYHCPDNYLPGALKYFEMADLASLIAPRKMVVVAGREDNIFPVAGVNKAYETIEQIYDAAGVPGNCKLVIGSGGHRFYADEAWQVFNELSGWK